MNEVDNKYKLKELITNTKVFAISTFATKFLMFLLIPFYTKMLSSSEFGTIELLTSTSSIIVTLISLGISEALFRFSFEEGESNNKTLQSFYTVSFWSSLFLSIISILSIPIINLNLSTLFLFISITSHYQNGLALYAKAIGRTVIFGINSVIFALVLGISNFIFLALLDLAIFGYLVSIILANICSIFFLIIIGRVPVYFLPRKSNGKISILLKYSVPLVFNSLAWMIISYLDKYMLRFLLSSSAVGIYAIAIKIPSLLNSVISIMIQAWTITTIKYLDKGKHTQVFYSQIFNFFFLSIIIIAFLLMSPIKLLMKYYVSPEFFSAYKYIPVLIIGSCFLGLMNFYGSILSSNRDSKSILISSSIGAIMNFVLNMVLIPFFGIMGASIATACSYFSIMVFRAIVTKTIVTIKIHKLSMMFSILILMIQATLISLGFDSILRTSALLCVLLAVNYNVIVKFFDTIKGKEGR